MHRHGPRLAHRVRLALGQMDAVAEQAVRAKQAVFRIDIRIVDRIGIEFAGEADLVVVFR